jgi:hypothetical protein
VNALANQEVGDYFRGQFVATFMKVGTFKVVNGQKQGGNVAAYFCRPDGRVLHAVAGPVDAATLLREARWVVEAHKLLEFQAGGDDDRLTALVRRAHADRLRAEHGIDLGKGKQRDGVNPVADFADAAFAKVARRKGLTNQGRVHLLLAAFPLARLEQVYEAVFEKILGEEVSTLPVTVKG